MKKKLQLMAALTLFIVAFIYTAGYMIFHKTTEVVIIIPKAVSHMPYSSNFWPSRVRVAIGVNNTVKWINLDDHTHTVTSVDWLFHSGELNLYDTFIYVFREKGVYRYVCLPHPWMEAVVEVVQTG